MGFLLSALLKRGSSFFFHEFFHEFDRGGDHDRAVIGKPQRLDGGGRLLISAAVLQQFTAAQVTEVLLKALLKPLGAQHGLFLRADGIAEIRRQHQIQRHDRAGDRAAQLARAGSAAEAAAELAVGLLVYAEPVGKGGKHALAEAASKWTKLMETWLMTL